MVVELDNNSFKKEVLQHKGFVVVDAWAPWCGPCKMIAPVIEKLSKEFTKIKFAKLNVDENSELAQEYGVMSIPCLIFFKDGEEVERIVGFGGEAPLREKIEKLV
ncbi:thioredoxin [Candidatus Woesearchaeota archaeon]|nr:thioredoxin [Candidatus Woesearchaeota archaeon]